MMSMIAETTEVVAINVYDVSEWGSRRACVSYIRNTLRLWAINQEHGGDGPESVAIRKENDHLIEKMTSHDFSVAHNAAIEACKFLNEKNIKPPVAN
jgi:hypothetical protein